MVSILRRRKALVPLLLIGILALSGVAVAFWTANGTGSGSATIGADSGVTIDPVSLAGTLYPGGSVAVSFKVTNDSSSTAIRIGKVVADTGTGTNGITGLPTGCSAADFTLADVAVNTEIAASGSYSGAGTLAMANTSSNQDACKGATPTIHLKVDNG